jgi:hypothetical protein
LQPRLTWIDLRAAELIEGLTATDAAGVRGGACYDFLHLVAARKAKVSTLITLNQRHFKAFLRPGDPDAAAP